MGTDLGTLLLQLPRAGSMGVKEFWAVCILLFVLPGLHPSVCMAIHTQAG